MNVPQGPRGRRNIRNAKAGFFAKIVRRSGILAVGGRLYLRDEAGVMLSITSST